MRKEKLNDVERELEKKVREVEFKERMIEKKLIEENAKYYTNK